MARAFLVVMDSLGVGGAPDAGGYFNGDLPDTGANTLGHIAAACAAGQADQGRAGPLRLPNLDALGLGAALRLASGARGAGLDGDPSGLWGVAEEISRGKDTPSGHWELAGLPVPWDWAYFPKTTPCFPDDIVAEVMRLAGTDGILGNEHASGTEIIDRLGAARRIEPSFETLYRDAETAASAFPPGGPRLLQAIQRLHDWKQEMIHGSGRH